MVSRVSVQMTVGAPLDNQVSSRGQSASFGYAGRLDRPDFFLSGRIPRLEDALAGIFWNIPITGRKARKLRRVQLGLPILFVDSLVAKRGRHFQGGHVHQSRQWTE